MECQKEFYVLMLWLTLLIDVSSEVNMSEYIARTERSKGNVERMSISEGEDLHLVCYAPRAEVRGHRWVYVREGTKRPQVLSSGHRLIVAEPRLQLNATGVGNKIALTLTLKDIRKYESGLFMCWRQKLKPEPQVYVTVLESKIEAPKHEILEIIAPSEVKYGDSVEIICKVSPSSAKVTWLQDGIPVPSDDRLSLQKEEKEESFSLAILKISSLRKSSNFTCRLSTETALEKTAEVKLKVIQIESLEASQDLNSVDYGDRLVFTCTVTGADSQIVWLKNGAELKAVALNVEIVARSSSPEKTESELVFESLAVSDNGQYTCYVPGASKNVVINIEGRPPKFLDVTADDFFPGDVLTIKCRLQYAKKLEASSVSWFFNAEPMNPNWETQVLQESEEKNVTAYTLLVNEPKESHAGNYSCETPHGRGTASVRQFVPPYMIISPPLRVRIMEGDPLHLICEASGHPTPATFWEREFDGAWEKLENLEMSNVTVDKGNVYFQTGSIEHAGNYRCRAQSGSGVNDANTLLIVSPPPPEITALTATDVLEGKNLIVTCSVKNLDGEVEFYRDNILLTTDLDERILVTPDNETYNHPVTTYILNITNSKFSDRGQYECRTGTNISKTISVNINVQPKVVEVTSSSAVVGSDFFVSCTLKNWPKGKISFYHQDTLLNDMDSGRYSVHLAQEQDIEEGFGPRLVTYVLKVSNATLDDEGIYRCYISGGVEGYIYVPIKIPIKVEMNSSDAILGENFTISCTVTNWEGEVEKIFASRFYVEKFVVEEEKSRILHNLCIYDIKSNDSGIFECYVNPDVYATVNISVRAPKQVEMQLRDPSDKFWPNSTLTLECVVQGFDPTAVDVDFIHAGRRISRVIQLSEVINYEERAAAHIPTSKEAKSRLEPVPFWLSLHGVTKSDGGKWKCRVSDSTSGDFMESGMEVVINEPPKFTAVPPEEINGTEGKDLEVLCSASGFPDPNVIWYKDEEVITILLKFNQSNISYNNNLLITDSRMSVKLRHGRDGSKLIYLIVKNVTMDDAGTYECTTNTYPPASHSRSLQVLAKGFLPNLIDYLDMEIDEKINGTVGENATLPCIVFDFRRPVYTRWKKGIRILFDYNKSRRVDKRFSFAKETIGKTDTYNLVIEEVAEEDSGIYSCSIMQFVKKIHLNVTEKPVEITESPESTATTTGLETEQQIDFTSDIPSLVTVHAPLLTTHIVLDAPTVDDVLEVSKTQTETVILTMPSTTTLKPLILSPSHTDDFRRFDILPDLEFNLDDFEYDITKEFPHFVSEEKKPELAETTLSYEVTTLDSKLNIPTESSFIAFSTVFSSALPEIDKNQFITTTLSSVESDIDQDQGSGFVEPEMLTDLVKIDDGDDNVFISTTTPYSTSKKYDSLTIVKIVGKDVINDVKEKDDHIPDVEDFDNFGIDESVSSGDFERGKDQKRILYDQQMNHTLKVVTFLSSENLELSCPYTGDLEDLSWKHDQELLFLGSQNFASVKGLLINSEGSLIVEPEYPHTLSTNFTCYVFDFVTLEDLPLLTYQVVPSPDEESYIPDAEGQLLFFPDLGEETPLVLANSERALKSLSKVLRDGGVEVVLSRKKYFCESSDEVIGLEDALEALKNCENGARESGLVTTSQAVFIAIDFVVWVQPDSLFGSTLVYVNSGKSDIQTRVFSSLIPLPEEYGQHPSNVQVPHSWWDAVQNPDLACSSTLQAAVVALEDSYLTLQKMTLT